MNWFSIGYLVVIALLATGVIFAVMQIGRDDKRRDRKRKERLEQWQNERRGDEEDDTHA